MLKKKNACIHSQIEKDVFHYLLKGSQPIILMLARGMKKILEPELKDAIAQNRLLILSPFDEIVKWITKETAQIRNEKMFELADEIFVAYASQLAGFLAFNIVNRSNNYQCIAIKHINRCFHLQTMCCIFDCEAHKSYYKRRNLKRMFCIPKRLPRKIIANH